MASEVSNEKQETKNLIFFLECKEGVTTTTIICMFLVFFTNFSLSSYLLFMVVFFFEDPETYNLSPEKALSTAAWLLFVSYPFNLITCVGTGYLFARFGRRKLIIMGFLVAITCLIMVPFFGTTLYPSLLLMAIGINMGTAFTQNPPLIPDYIRPNSIGKAYAFQGLITFMATLFAVAVLFGATSHLPFKQAIVIVCPILYLLACISTCGLIEPKSSIAS